MEKPIEISEKTAYGYGYALGYAKRFCDAQIYTEIKNNQLLFRSFSAGMMHGINEEIEDRKPF